MNSDEPPVYDERHRRAITEETTKLMNEFEQTHKQATNNNSQTDKIKANGLRIALESQESELRKKKSLFPLESSQGEIESLTIRVQSLLYRLCPFPAQLAITDGRGDNSSKHPRDHIRHIIDVSNPTRLMMLSPQQRAGPINFQSILGQPQLWHHPLIYTQPTSSSTSRTNHRPLIENHTSANSNHPPIEMNNVPEGKINHSRRTSLVTRQLTDERPYCQKEAPSIRQTTNSRSPTPILSRRPCLRHPHSAQVAQFYANAPLHSTDYAPDDYDHASHTTLSSCQSDQTLESELIDLSTDGASERVTIQRRYDEVVKKKQSLNDRYHVKLKQYNDKCQMLLGKLHSFADSERFEGNVQIGHEGQADMEKEFNNAEDHERINRTRSWVNSHDSVHPSDSVSVASYLGLPKCRPPPTTPARPTPSPHSRQYQTQSHCANDQPEASRTLANGERAVTNHPHPQSYQSPHPPQNHPHSYQNQSDPSLPQRQHQPMHQMRSTQSYTVISQTQGKRATETHILATQCATSAMIPQSPGPREYESQNRAYSDQFQCNHSQAQTNYIQNDKTRSNYSHIQDDANQNEGQYHITQSNVGNYQRQDHLHRHEGEDDQTQAYYDCGCRCHLSGELETQVSRPSSPNHHDPNLQLPRSNNNRQPPSPNYPHSHHDQISPNLPNHQKVANNGRNNIQFLPSRKSSHTSSTNNHYVSNNVETMAASPARNSSIATENPSNPEAISLNPKDRKQGLVGQYSTEDQKLDNNDGNTDFLRFFAAKDARDFLKNNRLPEEQRFSGDGKVDFESVLLRYETITDQSGIPPRELIFELKHYFSGEAAKICELYEGKGDAKENLRKAIEHLKEEFGCETRSIHNKIDRIISGGPINRNNPSEFKAWRIELITAHAKAKKAGRDSIFNNADTINKILVEKIPFCLNRWAVERSKQLTNMTSDTFDPEPNFEDFLQFLSQQNRIREEMEAIHSVAGLTTSKKDNIMTINAVSHDTQGGAKKGSENNVTQQNECSNNNITGQNMDENNWTCHTCLRKAYHELYNCEIFLALDQEDRFTQVRSNGACLKCLHRGHKVNRCQAKTNCQICNRPYHHTLLHRFQNQNGQKQEVEENDDIDSLSDESEY